MNHRCQEGDPESWVGADSTAFFANQINYTNSLNNVAIPSYAEGPLSSLSNIAIDPATFRKGHKKKKNRMNAIEARFGMKVSSKKIKRRSQHDLMLDLTPKWQRPAVKEHYRSSRADAIETARKKKTPTPTANQRKKAKMELKRTRKEERQRANAQAARTQAVEQKVAEKYNALHPAWRSVAALEDDDGTTKSAIAALLHSGMRLELPGGNETTSLGSSSNAQERTPQRTQQSLTNKAAWKPQFLSATPGEKARKAAAVAKLKSSMGVVNHHGGQQNDHRNRNKTTGVVDRSSPGRSERGRESGRGRGEVRERGRGRNRERSRTREQTKAKKKTRQRTSITNQKRSTSTVPRKRPAWGGGSTKSQRSSTQKQERAAGRRRKLRQSESHSSAISAAYGNTSTSATARYTNKKHRKPTTYNKRSSSQPPTQRKATSTSKRTRHGMRSSHSTSTLHSKEKTRTRPRVDASSTTIRYGSGRRRGGGGKGGRGGRGGMNGATRGGIRNSRSASVLKTATFLTSLGGGATEVDGNDAAASPMRGRLRAKRSVRSSTGRNNVRGSARTTTRNRNGSHRTRRNNGRHTSRGLGGFNQELNGIAIDNRRINKKRAVRSAPTITTMTSLRLSPNSKSKRNMAWMQQPVLQRKKGRSAKGQGKNSRSSSIEQSRHQLSKLTSTSQRQRKQRADMHQHQQEKQHHSRPSRGASHRPSPTQQHKQTRPRPRGVERGPRSAVRDYTPPSSSEGEDDEDSMSSTFLTGMITSPPRKPKPMYSQLSRLSMPMSSGSEEEEGGERERDEEKPNEKIENDENNMSSIFLTSGSQQFSGTGSPDSPRLSKRIRGKRRITRSQKEHVVKRNLGKALW
jgi:hypothetical protein